MLRFLLNYFLFTSTMFAAGAPAVGGQGGSSDGATSGASSSGSGASGGGTSTDQSGASGNDSGRSGPAGQPNDQGLKQLREAYEGVKAKFEPYEKLNLKPDQIQQYSGVYQKLYGEAQNIGTNLGYTEQEIAEALALNPVATMDLLRTQMQQAEQERQQSGRADLEDMAQQLVEQRLGPIEQRENQRMTDAANQLFEQTTRQLAVESFKAEGLDVANIPPEEMDLLMSATSEILKYDQDALKALKYEGKTAAIQKAFQEARTAFDKYYLARVGRDKTRLQPARPGQPASPANGAAKKHTLDELIDNPGLISQKYA
jgi:hypothetical protein